MYGILPNENVNTHLKNHPNERKHEKNYENLYFHHHSDCCVATNGAS